MSTGEVITIHVGGGGIRMGEAFWKKTCRDFNVDFNGKATDKPEGQNTYFRSTSSGFRPRAIFADLAPNDLEYIKSFDLKNLCNWNLSHSGKVDSGCWANGHYTDGAEIVDKIMDSISNEANNCDNLQGFLIFGSLTGGAGGLNNLISSKVMESFPEKEIIGIHNVLSSRISSSSIEPYNSCLAFAQTIENQSSSVLFDVGGSTKVANIDAIKYPEYSDYNNYIASIPDFFHHTDNKNFVNYSDAKKKLTYSDKPRLHFLVPSVIPNNAKNFLDDYYNYIINGQRCLSEIDIRHGLILKAHISVRNLNYNLDSLTGHMKKFVDHNTSYFTSECKEVTASKSIMKNQDCSVVGLVNSTAVTEKFKMTSEKFCATFRRKSFLHFFTCEGMDEMEFTEAESNLNDLISEYQSVA